MFKYGMCTRNEQVFWNALNEFINLFVDTYVSPKSAATLVRRRFNDSQILVSLEDESTNIYVGVLINRDADKDNYSNQYFSANMSEREIAIKQKYGEKYNPDGEWQSFSNLNDLYHFIQDDTQMWKAEFLDSAPSKFEEGVEWLRYNYNLFPIAETNIE